MPLFASRMPVLLIAIAENISIREQTPLAGGWLLNSEPVRRFCPAHFSL